MRDEDRAPWRAAAEEQCRELRKRMLRLAYSGKDANLQSNFSAVDIMWVIYDQLMACPGLPEENSFVLSKGQATLGLICVLEAKGILHAQEVSGYGRADSRFGMQADRTRFQGEIEISAGSLGHGLPMAVGMAMADQILGRKRRIFVLTGDGEFNEGTMWEAVLLAGSRRLDQLCIVVDHNHSTDKMLDMGSLAEKLNTFGFETADANGHDYLEVYDALRAGGKGRAKAVIAHTVRGYGCETMMRDSRWFHRAPDQEELRLLLREVEHFAHTNV